MKDIINQSNLSSNDQRIPQTNNSLLSKFFSSNELIKNRRITQYLDGRKESGNKPHQKCQEIAMTDRAFAQIYNETKNKGKKETGGLLLGHYIDGVWYIIESSDPGYNGVFDYAYHESDKDYANHVCAILSRIYKYPLMFLGMWHRHPGSMDSFSGTDDITNTKYAESAGNGCISLLVNKDPDFRLTAYYVEISESNITYTKTDILSGDKYITRKEAMEIATKNDIDKRS